MKLQLERANDNLELFERRRDKMDGKAIEIMTNLRKNLYNEREKNAKLVQFLDSASKAELNDMSNVFEKNEEMKELRRTITKLKKECEGHESLQVEFNNVLNNREEEIDELNSKIFDLKAELEMYEGGSDPIAIFLVLDLMV